MNVPPVETKTTTPIAVRLGILIGMAGALCLAAGLIMTLLPQREVITDTKIAVIEDPILMSEPGELKVAGIRIVQSGYQNSPYTTLAEEMEGLLSKIQNLLTVHPDTDLVVTPEFLFSILYLSSPNADVLVACNNGACGVSPGNENSESQIVTDTVQQIVALAQQHSVSFSLGTFREVDASGQSVGNTALVVNQDGVILGGKRKGSTDGPQGPLTPFALTSHHGQPYTILPIICGERADAEVLDYARSFNVDVIAHSVAEGDGVFEPVSDFLTNGNIATANLLTVPGWSSGWSSGGVADALYRGDLYQQIFSEEYRVNRNVASDNSLLVASDLFGGQAGVYSLKYRPLRYLSFTEDYAVGIGTLARTVSEATMADGFGSRPNEAVITAATDGTTLLMGTYNVDGGAIFSTTDGASWVQDNANGFIGTENYIIANLAMFNGSWYATTRRSYDGWGGYDWNYRGAGVWRQSSSGNWEQVNDPGFGNETNTRVSSLAVFGSHLYAGTYNNTGTQIWRTADGTTWQQVNANGFGNLLNQDIPIIASFDGTLFAMTYSREYQGLQIWRTTDGTTWEKATADGFGDGKNMWSHATTVFNDALYVGTFNDSGGAVWRTMDGTTWQQVNVNGFGGADNLEVTSLGVHDNALYAGTWNIATGGEVWQSGDGVSWQQVNNDGFGNRQNRNITTLTSFNNTPYATTWNADGTQLWSSATGNTWARVTPTVGYTCGDINHSGEINVSDIAYFIAYLFRDGPAPTVMASADVDQSGGINVADITYFIQYVFNGGPAPCQPQATYVPLGSDWTEEEFTAWYEELVE